MFEMKEEYLTGIKMVDEEHKRLFELADEAHQLQKEEFLSDKYDQIRHILEELREYTRLHFEHEEKYMESINYKRIFSQKVQHDLFREKIAEWDIDSIDENQDEAIGKIATMLTDWLIDHILYMDKLIGEE